MRRWWFPLVVVVVFGLLLWLVQVGDRPPLTAEEENSPSLLALQPSSVNELSISSGKTTLRLLRRQEDGFKWWLEPQQVPANSLKVESLLEALADLGGKPLKPEVENLKVFGLEAPSWRVEVLQDNGETEVLQVGDSVPVSGVDQGREFYAMVSARPEVFMVDGWVVDELGGTLDDWREYYPFRLPDGNAVYVSMQWKGHQLTAQSEENRWVLTGPDPVEVESSKVLTLINKLSFMEAWELVNDDPVAEEIGAYGLNEPWLKAVLSGGGEGPPLTREVLIGNKAGNQPRYYARLGGRPGVYLVEATSVAELENAGEELLK